MTAATFVTCRAKCAGGHVCVCAKGHHAPHICRDPACACHTAAGYGLRPIVRHGVEVYVPDDSHGAAEVVRVLGVQL